LGKNITVYCRFLFIEINKLTLANDKEKINRFLIYSGVQKSLPSVFHLFITQ